MIAVGGIAAAAAVGRDTELFHFSWVRVVFPRARKPALDGDAATASHFGCDGIQTGRCHGTASTTGRRRLPDWPAVTAGGCGW